MSEWTWLGPVTWWQQTRLYLAWRLLRGDTIAYRLTIRDGGIDVRGTERAHVVDCAVIGGQVGLHMDGLPADVRTWTPEQAMRRAAGEGQ
jgi:hypothetical protein